MKKLIIDRFEGSYAICELEGKTTLKVPKYKLPLESKEGDCLIQDSDGMYRKDVVTTKNLENRIREKMNRLFAG
ncbi:MAG: hypothetical protein K0S04_4224 [Herbinix sp.]|jgi:hypothetical protein|nr:hypothetical protein [Herbinix sp.]